MAAGAGRLRAAGTDAGVGRGCPGRGGWRRGGRGRRGGNPGPAAGLPGASVCPAAAGGFGAPPRVRRAPGSRKDTANLPARPRLCKGVPPPAGCARAGAGEGRAAGRLFSRLPELPHPTAGSWAGRGPAPGAWVRRAAPRRVCAAREGRRWGVGRRGLGQLFFLPPVQSPTSSPAVGEGRRGPGEGKPGTAGSTARPGPPAARSRRRGRAGWCPRPPGGLRASVSSSSFPWTQRADTWCHCRLLSISQAAGSVRGSVCLHPNI